MLAQIQANGNTGLHIERKNIPKSAVFGVFRPMA